MTQRHFLRNLLKFLENNYLLLFLTQNSQVQSKNIGQQSKMDDLNKDQVFYLIIYNFTKKLLHWIVLKQLNIRRGRGTSKKLCLIFTWWLGNLYPAKSRAFFRCPCSMLASPLGEIWIEKLVNSQKKVKQIVVSFCFFIT